MALAAGTRLGPYEILALIGAGGMGEVWKARDTRLGRIVAIKKVKEQHSGRFKQEARTIAALNHPHICQLHDIGEDYLVLEYVEGKPLSSPLPEKEAVRLAIQIATALEEAHRQGIVHRDLKPSNIIMTDKGSVKLLDFGLAKLYEQDASASALPTADFPATQAGAILGTVAYMSPEQAQGLPADARSDIFSFGLLLYEMLSGRRAFASENPLATAAAIIKEEPPPLQSSPSLEKIVRRCLAKRPAERFQSMTEVRNALDQAGVRPVDQERPSIAVLPFVNMSGDKEQEYFSDGLAEEIINALTQIAGLKVIARTSAFAFKDKHEDLRKVAEVLGVANILEGSVRKAGNRIRVTAQLITAADGSHLWSERYDRELTDVFAIQDEISQAIAEKLRVRLSVDRPLAKRHKENVEAYNLYLKGHYHFNKLTPESLARSKDYFEQAIAADSDYALPWCGLAGLYYLLGSGGNTPPKAAIMQSRQAALKALELDDMLPEAHSAMAVLLAAEYDWKGAEREFLRALELGPEVWDVWGQYTAYYLVPMRRLDEAVFASRKALELDPLSPGSHQSLGWVYLTTRQYDRAIEQFHNALELEPHFYISHTSLGITYFQTGRSEEGIRAFETAARLRGRNALLGMLGFGYARIGWVGEAQKLLQELQDFAQKSYVKALDIANIYYGLGETERCLDWIEKAVDEHEILISTALVSPIYDPLRSHPRWKTLLRKMNLEPV